MARVRSGSAGAAWALVLLGAGFVICLILAIVFSVQLGDARQQAEQAQGELDDYVNPQQRESADVQRILESGEGSVVGQLLQTNQSLRSLIGAGDLSPDEIRERAASIVEEDSVSPLLRELEEQVAELEEVESRLEAAENRVAEARKLAQDRLNERNELQSAFDTSLQNISEQYFGQTESNLNERISTLQENFTEIEEQLQRVRSNSQEQVEELEDRIAELEAERDRLQRLVSDFKKETVGEAVVARPDGEILAVSEETDTVFINLGREDQLLLGITFEVFEQGKTVEYDEVRDERGKATIQVVEINEASARARIVRRSRDAFIREGDPIVNVVYDPEQRFHFFVYGAFDLTGSGEATLAQQQRIEDIILKWDGVIDDEFGYQTDFLILGERPEPPEPLDPDVIDPEKIAEFNRKQEVYQRYQELATQAEQLLIPILNQNRFLTLIGDYER